MFDCEVVIPTIVPKFDILSKTLFGVRSQKDVKMRVWVGVDHKPDYGLPEYPGDIELVPYPSTNLWNQSHSIINDIIKNRIDGNVPIIVMHDDYWIEEVKLFSRLLNKMGPETFRFVRSHERFLGLYADYTPFLFKHPIVRFSDIKYITGFVEKEEVCSDIISFSAHPFRGHPKCIMREDFLATEGYDTKNFSHYGWSDLDLFLRLMKRVKVKSVNGKVFHANHERYLPYSFESQNRSVFGSLHPGFMKSIESNVQKGIATFEFDDV